MPIHIYGSGGGGGGSAKNAIAVNFTPTNAQGHTITIDDVDFAQCFNNAKKAKCIELVLVSPLSFGDDQNSKIVYYCMRGDVDGIEHAHSLGLTDGLYTRGGNILIWDGTFTVSGNSATFNITLVSGVAFATGKQYQATWRFEE